MRSAIHSLVLLCCSVPLACCQEKPNACSPVASCQEEGALALLSVHRAQVTSDFREDAGVFSAAMIESRKLDRLLELAAESSPDGATKALFEQFKVCGQCKNFQRFGEKNDGGYLMCMDIVQKGSMSGAYSLGVEKHDQWSDDVVNALGLAVNQFDCTVPNSSCKGCKFFKKCIVSADGKHPVPKHEEEGWSLKEALEATSQAQASDGSLLMKMDIESSEWPIYMSEPPELLRKFGELIVEFHGLEQEARHAEYLQAIKNIKAAGFEVAHLHGNNFAGMYQQGELRIPQVLEVTFVHGATRPGGCAADQVYSPLDTPNNPGAPELPMAHMAA